MGWWPLGQSCCGRHHLPTRHARSATVLLPGLRLLCLPRQAAAETVVTTKEQFLDGDRRTVHWIESKQKSDFVQFILSASKLYGDLDKGKGLQTNQDARFYALPCWPASSP